jgi:signal transduction histidine kinase
LSPDQVTEIIVRQGFEALGACAGVIAIVSEDERHLEVTRMEGYSETIQAKWKRFPVAASLPLADAFRYRQAIFIESPTVLEERYPDADPEVRSPTPALAAIPLAVGSKAFGVMGLSFPAERNFYRVEKEFLLALAGQCAQALHRSQLYDDAQNAIRTRDEFLSIASHELKTPLTALRLQLQGFMRQVEKGKGVNLSLDRLNKIAQTSDRQVTRLTRLTEDLLDVSRISSERLSLDREEFDLGEMVKDVVARYGQQMVSLKTPVEIQAEPGIRINGDKIRIEQVLINLLMNAAKYAPGEPVKVFLSETADGARLSVQDRGPGIAAEDRERIFDRFERVRARDNVGGLGLGLYISRQIVAAHGGRLFVESRPGEGSTFVAEIPRAATSKIDFNHRLAKSDAAPVRKKQT